MTHSDFDLGLLQKRCAELCSGPDPIGVSLEVLERLEDRAGELGFITAEYLADQAKLIQVLSSVADVFVAGLMLAALHQLSFAAVVQARLVDLEAQARTEVA